MIAPARLALATLRATVWAGQVGLGLAIAAAALWAGVSVIGDLLGGLI